MASAPSSRCVRRSTRSGCVGCNVPWPSLPLLWGLGWWLGVGWGVALGTVLWTWSGWLSRKVYRGQWATTDGRHLSAHQGWWFRKRVMIDWHKLQAVELTQNRIHARRNVAHLTFHTSSGVAHLRFCPPTSPENCGTLPWPKSTPTAALGCKASPPRGTESPRLTFAAMNTLRFHFFWAAVWRFAQAPVPRTNPSASAPKSRPRTTPMARPIPNPACSFTWEMALPSAWDSLAVDSSPT